MKTIHLPIFGLRKNQITTNERIFRTLSHHHPKTVAELKAHLFSEYREKLSYQAVRKSVLTLRKQGILEHTKNGYELSLDWLLAVRSLMDETVEQYRIGQGRALAQNKSHQVFTSRSLYDLDTFWGEVVINLCKRKLKSTKRKFISINHFPWWVPINVGHEAQFCADLKKLGFQVIFVFLSSGPSTTWAKEFYHNLGVEVHICRCPSIPQTHYYNVIGDTVIEVALNKELADTIEKLFGARQKPERIPPQSLVKLTKQRGNIRLSIQESAAFAMGLLQGIKLK